MSDSVAAPPTTEPPYGNAGLPQAFADQDDKNYIKFEGLDPVLGTLGVMIGLLIKDESAEDTYLLDYNWFKDPYNLTKSGITQNSKQIGNLIGQLLGSVGGNALGVPVKDPAILGTWYPIQLKDKETEQYKPTGLYVVSIENTKTTGEGEDKKTEIVSNAIGLGVLKRWDFGDDSGAQEGLPVGIEVDVWASIPVAVISDSGVSLTFADKDNINPVTIGIAVEGPDPANPIVSVNDIEFNGVKFSSNLFLQPPSPSFEVSFEVLGLQLANDSEPRNYSLADLQAITPLDILDTAVNLFMGALMKQFPKKETELGYFAPLFGFSSKSGVEGVSLPLMQWVSLIENAIENANEKKAAAQPFFDWFNALSADTATLQAWMGCLTGFLGLEVPEKLPGLGTRNQPFQAPILEIPKVGSVNLNVGTQTTGEGVRFFYPGLSFTSKSLQIAESPAYFAVEADLELAQFRLAKVAAAPVAEENDVDLSLNFVASFGLTGKDGGLLLDNFQDISLGKLSGGLAVGALTGKVVPHFELINLTLPAQRKAHEDGTTDESPNKFGVVNLLSPEELANVGAVALSGELQKLILGDDPDNQEPFREAIAVLLGLIAPANHPADWITPPFSEPGITESIKNPIHAWTQYYLDVLKAPAAADGTRPFTYMLKSFAGMLRIGEVSLDVTGGGTPKSPWEIGLTVADSEMPVHLTAYEDTTSDTTLVFGLNLAPQIELGGVKIVPAISLEAVQIVLFDDKPAAANWFNFIEASISLPEEISTPKLGDAVISVSKVALSGGWGQSQGWSWSMLIAEPSLTIGDATPIKGANLSFSERDNWQTLIEDSAKSFGPFLTGAMGIGLMRTNTRPGLLATASLGLLTDLSPYPVFQQTGLKWDGFEGIKLDNFGDPLQLLRDQIVNKFDTTEHAQSFLGLLSWAITNADKAPAIKGKGNLASPYLTPIPFNTNLPVWYDTSTDVIGLGLSKDLSFNYSLGSEKINIDVATRLNLVEYSLSTGAIVKNDDTPALNLKALVTNQDSQKHLVDLPAGLGYLGSLEVGFSCAVVSGALNFKPVVVLHNAKLEGQDEVANYNLLDFLADKTQLQTAFMSMLNAGLQATFNHVKDQKLFQDVYNLLTSLGLTIAADFESLVKKDAADSASAVNLGLNQGGWNALLANPIGFMETQFIAFLNQEDSGSTIINLVQQLTGINFPKVPVPALQLLSGLEIVGSQEDNFPLRIQTVLEIISNPVEEIKTRFESMITDTEKRKTLAKQLTQNIKPTAVGYFELSANTNGVVTFEIPESAPIKIGTVGNDPDNSMAFVELSGGLSLSLADDSISVTFRSGIPKLELSLQNVFSVALNGGQIQLNPPAIDLIWGMADKPAAAPFHIFPIAEAYKNDVPKFYIEQFVELAPAYALNTVANLVLESELVSKYPVVQQILTILGIARDVKPEAEGLMAMQTGGGFQMQSIIGLIKDPLGWLLSDDVLGTDGRFDIVKLTEKLALIPNASYTPQGGQPITIGPNDAANGMQITGLPYNFFVEISGDTTKGKETASFNFGTKSVEIVEGASVNDLFFSVGVTPQYQASIGGGVKLATNKIGEFFVDFNYDDSFGFSFGSGKPDAPGVVVQFLPFIGWGALAGQAGTLAATQIIEKVVPVVIKKLEDKAPKFAEALTDFGTNIPVKALFDSIAGIVSNPSKDVGHELEEASLAWLKGLFDNDAQLPKTIKAVEDIFKNVPQSIGTVTVDKNNKGLLVFCPGVDLPIKILFGVDKKGTTKNLGIWVELTIPEIPYLSINVLQTGVGVDLATLTDVKPYFGFEVIVPLDGTNGPGISLLRDAESGFILMLDPEANQEYPNKKSQYAVELLPTFFAEDGKEPADLGESVRKWTLAVIQNVLPRYVSVLVLNNEYVKPWLDYNLLEKLPSVEFEISAAQLLLATTLIIEKDIPGSEPAKKEYLLNYIEEIKKITPLSFLSHLLKELLKDKITIFKFGDTGSVIIGPRTKEEGNNEYGINILAPDFKIEKAPNIVLQLGGKDSEWISKTTEAKKPDQPEEGTVTIVGQGENPEVKPGVQFYVPIDFKDDGPEANFDAFRIVLGNVGFDIIGKDGKPIVDLSRFKLGGVEPRILLDLKFNGKELPDVTFGGNLTLADMGLLLTPAKLESGDDKQGEASNSSNAIASNLLGAASEGEKDPKNPAPNPTFSIQAAYTQDFTEDKGKFWVNLASSTGSGKEIIFPIQRSFGPLFIDDLGVGWDDGLNADGKLKTDKKSYPMLDILFSGNVELAGLKLELIGLDVGIPVTTPTDFGAYSISLDGLDLSYKGGAVTINGGLLKQETDDYIEYSGAAVIKASSFSIMALGSYAQIKDKAGKNVTSLFIFGAIDIPLGGPPAFFITGLAAGFGFNRSIKIPTIENVMNFPLLTGVLHGTLSSGDKPEAALQVLGDTVTPQVGQYWLAAGLKFRSFELINTAALLFIEFGNNFEINILGLSYAALPPAIGQDKALAYFELALKIAIKPDAGVVSVEAMLTPNSFILTRDCKVTGGFAFYLWFKDTTQLVDGKEEPVPKGQFVVTLGGYHPKFKAPVYYPKVPRLGLLWNMDFTVGSLSINGGTYFAICPTAVMAGGYLDATFKAGPLKAWLNAYANFLIEWKPFYFNVGIGITVGVSFGFEVAGVSITLSIQMSAVLELEGPPVGGYIKVDWVVISFTIPFGDKKPATTDNNLGSWDAFATSFLPAPAEIDDKKAAPKALAKSNSLTAATDPTPLKRQQIIKWNSGKGLLSDNGEETPAESSPWLVSIMHYSFNVKSVIPVDKLTAKLDDNDATYIIDGIDNIGVRPMGFTKNLGAPIEMVVKDSKGNIVNLVDRFLQPAASLDGSPAALWSQTPLSKDAPPSGDDMIIKSTLVGATLTADTYRIEDAIKEFKIANMKYTFNNPRLLPYALRPTQYEGLETPFDQNKPFTQIKRTIMADGSDGGTDVVGLRNEIYAALASVPAYPVPTKNALGQDFNALQMALLKSRAVVSINAPQSPDLSVMAHSAELIFQVFPTMAPIGLYQNKGQTTAAIPYNPTSKAVLTKAAKMDYKTPVLEGVLRRHTAAAEAGGDSGPRVQAKWTGRNQLIMNETKRFQRKSGQSFMAAKAKAKKSSVNQKRLYEGGAYIWRLDSRRTHSIKISGKLSAVAYCFDAVDNLVDKLMVVDGQSIELPRGIAQVAVLAHEPKQHQCVGWERTTRATKINSKWAMTDGALLAVQNGQRLKTHVKARKTGIITVNRLLNANNVLNTADELRSGWVQTSCFTNDKFIGVMTNSPDPEALKAGIMVNDLPEVFNGSKCERVIEQGDGNYVHVFKVPQKKGVKQLYAGIIVKPKANTGQILAIYSMGGVIAKSMVPEFKLIESAIDLATAANKSAQLSIL